MSDIPHNPLKENRAGNTIQVTAVCVLLLLAVVIIFGQTLDFDFINLDDDLGVSDNPWVQEGLTAKSVHWAFTNRRLGNWDPVTWISHIIDWQLFGDNAGGHHSTNLLLHAGAAILLFLALRKMTGVFWPCALAASLFAVHPLRVESVAWITERKDVLSGFFFMLTLLAYAGYVRHGRFSTVRYLAVIVCFTLGMLSKPMLVTLPCVLLLLDYWPLRRFSAELSTEDTLVAESRVGQAKRSPTTVFPAVGGAAFRLTHPTKRSAEDTLRLLTIEKIPLFIIAAVCCVITVWAQHVPDYEHGPWDWKIGNSAISAVNYLARFFYPVGLAPLETRTSFDLPVARAVGCALILLGISIFAFLWPRKRPYLPVGWLWYVGMIIPVIGLVPFGTQAMADRFTYLPQIGLCIALAWGAAELCRTRPSMLAACSLASVAAIVVLMACAWQQTTYWRDSETLLKRTLACTSNNYMAHNSLGNALAKNGKLDEAAAQYRKAIELLPNYSSAYYNLGVTEGRRGRLYEAITQYRKALRANPNLATAHNNLADALLTIGRTDEAIEHAGAAIQLVPDNPKYHFTLGNIWLIGERFNGAVEEYQNSLDAGSQTPAECHIRLALALIRLNRRAEAAEHYRKALEIEPTVLDDRPELDVYLSKEL